LVDGEDLIAGAEVPPVALVENDRAEGGAFADHLEEEGDDADFGGGRDAAQKGGFDEVDAGEEEAGFEFGEESASEVADAVGGGIEGDLEGAVFGAEHEGDFVLGGLVGGPRLVEGEGREDIAVVDPERGVFGQESFGGFEASGGFEDLGEFVAEVEGASLPRAVGEGLGIDLGTPVGVDDELLDAGLVEVAEGPGDEGFVADGDEGFGAGGGEGFESGAESGAEDESGGGRKGHGRRGKSGARRGGRDGMV
jgi:hypothetical protein